MSADGDKALAADGRPKSDRLDVALVGRGLVVSRSRARDLIRRGEVAVDGIVAVRPAQLVEAGHRLALVQGSDKWVSRGALKLEAALDKLAINVTGGVGLDIGAATGGFTQILLQAGARKVYAVENGHGQLALALQSDRCVVSLEHTDARALTSVHIPEPIDVIVVDVSFISLLKVLPSVLPFAGPGCRLVALVKPQFEAEPGAVSKKGVMRDEKVRARVISRVEAWLAAQPGWRVIGTLPSPIKGGSGNIEHLIGATYDG